MNDLEIILANDPGQLALLGETLGKNKIILEGGGVFTNGETAIAHFLVKDAEKAKLVLESVGIVVPKINEVIIQKLRQACQGNLVAFAVVSPIMVPTYWFNTVIIQTS